MLAVLIGTADLSGQAEPRLVLPEGHTRMVTSAMFSPDGSFVLTASEDGKARVFESASGKELLILEGHKSTVWFATFSPDGQKILTAGLDKTSKLYDINTGVLLHSLDGHTDEVTYVQFSPDGKLIATASRDSTSRLFDSETGELLNIFKGHSSYLVSVNFSPSTNSDPNGGKYLLTASDDHSALIFETATGKLHKKIQHHKEGLRFAFYSHDGRYVLTASKDKTVAIFNAVSGELLQVLRGHKEWINSATFSPDLKYIVTASDDHAIHMYETETGNLIRIISSHTGQVFYAVFNQDGRYIASAGADHKVKVFETSTGKEILSINNHDDMVFSVQYSPYGEYLLTASLDKSSRLFDATTGKQIHAFEGKVVSMNTLKFNTNGQYYISAANDNTVKIIDFNSEKVLKSFRSNSASLNAAIFSPGEKTDMFGSKYIAMAGRDGIVDIIEITTENIHQTIKTNKVINSMDLSPDGNLLALAGTDKIAEVYNIHSGAKILEIKGHSDWIRSVEFSPDGNYLLTAGFDKKAKVFETQTGKEICSLEGHISYLENARFSKDGKYIATAGWDKTSKVYDLLSCREKHSFDAHADLVTAAVFSPDGKFLLTASRDNKARVFDLSENKIRVTLDEHENGLYAAEYSPDGKFIITTGSDFRTIIWDAATGNKLLTRLQLTGDDWLVYDDEYRYDGSPGARDFLYFVCGLEIIDLAQLKDALYVPGLSMQVKAGNRINFPGITDIEICDALPLVEKLENSSDAYVYKITPKKYPLQGAEVYINQKRIFSLTVSELKHNHDHYILELKKEELTQHFIAGSPNEIKVIGLVQQEGSTIRSRGLQMISDIVEEEVKAPSLFALMIGVNDYKEESLRLSFPSKDAVDLGKAIEISTKNLFGDENVFLYMVHSKINGETGFSTPEKENIKKAFEDIGQKAKAQDIILIFFAGHGIMYGSEEKLFTFLTSEATKDDPVGINTRDLQSWLSYDGPHQILANKTILIFDACHSGQATNELLSMARTDEVSQKIRQVEDLKDRSGVFILAASAPDQVAYELHQYEQGLLTYSLLHTLRNNPDALDSDTYLNVQKWFLESESFLNRLIKSLGYNQDAQPFGTANLRIARVDENVKSSINLARQKPLIMCANVLNDNTFDDDLQLKNLINHKLSEISHRGANTELVFPRVETPETNRINIRYEILGDEISCEVRLLKKNSLLLRKTITGSIDQLEDLANRIIEEALRFAI